MPRLWMTLGWCLLLAGCATPFGAGQRNFQLLPPATFEQTATILLTLDSSARGDLNHHFEAVLNVNVNRIDLIILGPLGQRLSTLNYDGKQLAIDRSGPISTDIPLEKLLGELQMIFWPLAALNAGKSNHDWFFREEKHVRLVYYRQQLMAEILRDSSSTGDGSFSYVSKISDYRLSIRSSQLSHP